MRFHRHPELMKNGPPLGRMLEEEKEEEEKEEDVEEEEEVEEA